MAKSKNQEILEKIKKNDPRFKDMIIEKSYCDFPSYEQFLKDIGSNGIEKINKDAVYVNESHNTPS